MNLNMGENKMSLLGLLFGESKKNEKPIFVKDFSKENKQLND